MGAWGAGLYSNDFALDLRNTAAAIARLPFDPDRLLEILIAQSGQAPGDGDDEDHATFWLVVADQFWRRGLIAPAARERALKIIDDDRDLSMNAALGMSEALLRKRRQMLQELKAKLSAPPSAKRGPTIKKPQPFIFEVGDLIAFPACGGNAINPYFTPPALRSVADSRPWVQDGWSALVMIDRGRAFDFLVWYRGIILDQPVNDMPAQATVSADWRWQMRRPGTCSTEHFKRMRMQRTGHFKIDTERLMAAFGPLPSGNTHAISNISIANQLFLVRATSRQFTAGSEPAVIDSLDLILQEN